MDRNNILRKEIQAPERDEVIGQFQYFKIQLKTIDLRTRLWGINPTNAAFYSQEPHVQVYCLQLNLVITGLGVTPIKLVHKPSWNALSSAAEDLLVLAQCISLSGATVFFLCPKS